MDKETSAKPSLGTWSNLPTEDTERKPKVNFEVNVPLKITFKFNDPREYSGDKGAYYIFEVKEGEEDKVLMTSAWTLLATLKRHTPLQNKTLTITKKSLKGKQFFEVADESSSMPDY